VLEVGFGTGALTQAIIEWIDSIDRPINVGHSIPLIRFFGIDRAYSLMFPLLQQRIKGIDEERYNISLSEGTLWSALPPSISNAKPFDIICGSLVLHDLIAADPLEKFGEMLKICRDFLTPGGRLIFADIFPHGDPATEENEKVFWHNWMERNGLPEKEINNFFHHNTDMLNTVNQEQVALAATENGYDFLFERLYTANNHSPFRVLMLTKIQST
jgi:SAM-dependent methyltransferase